MKYITARCTNCGASLEFQENKRVHKCNYCQSTIVTEYAVEFANISEDEASQVRRLRENLKDSVSRNNVNEIKRVASLIKDLIPNDLSANYYFGYAMEQLQSSSSLYSFYEGSLEGSNEEVDETIDHIIKYSELRDKKKVIHFISNYNSNKLSKYLDVYEERKDRLDYYDSSVKRDVFVCHRSTDLELVEQIVDFIEEDGYECWVSYRNLRPNDTLNYWDSIEEAIDNCSLFLVIASEEAMLSKDVQGEVKYAIKKNKHRLEYKVDDGKHTRLFRDAFDGKQWIDGTLPNGVDKLSERIHKELLEKSTNFKRKKHLPIIMAFISMVLIVGYFALSGVISPTNQEDDIPIDTGSGNNNNSQTISKDTEPPTISLIGQSVITIEKGTKYIEQSAVCTDSMSECTIESSGRVDYNTVGTYILEYQARDFSGNLSDLINRTVNVVDTTRPTVLSELEFELSGESESILYELEVDEFISEYSINGGIDYIEVDYLTNSIEVELSEGEYEIVIKDLYGNKSWSYVLVIIPDSTKPIITSSSTNHSLEYTLESNENITRYSLDNGSKWVALDLSVDSVVISLDYGSYQVVVEDMMGNVSDVLYLENTELISLKSVVPYIETTFSSDVSFTDDAHTYYEISYNTYEGEKYVSYMGVAQDNNNLYLKIKSDKEIYRVIAFLAGAGNMPPSSFIEQWDGISNNYSSGSKVMILKISKLDLEQFTVELIVRLTDMSGVQSTTMVDLISLID